MLTPCKPELQQPDKQSLSLKDVADWILVHRRKNAFKNHTYGDICYEVYRCYRNDSMFVDIACDGSICGFISWDICKDDEGIIYGHIRQVLSTTTGSMGRFWKTWLDKHDGLTVVEYLTGNQNNGKVFKRKVV